MPIYEYQCHGCGETFEALRKLSDPPLDACRLCGEGDVRRLVSAPAFRLKGEGWYETDFKKNNQRNLVRGDGDGGGSGEGGKSEAGANGGSEAKNDSAAKRESGAKSDSGAKGASDSRAANGSGSSSEKAGAGS